jgi:hypothetical protein
VKLTTQRDMILIVPVTKVRVVEADNAHEENPANQENAFPMRGVLGLSFAPIALMLFCFSLTGSKPGC